MEDTEIIEKGLLLEAASKQGDGFTTLTFPVFCEEVKIISYVAAPMVFVNLSQYFLQVISLMMVGHLGELALSSTAIAVSFCAVTGFSLLYGMSTAMETLCGQAYGAQQYQKLGILIYTAIFCLILACFPLTLLWLCMPKIFIAIGQDPLISQEAGKFTLWLLPALFAYATLQPLVRFFQVQSLIFPLLVSACATICFHIFICWTLVFKFGLGNFGAALSIGISYWLNVIFLGLYMNYSPACSNTRGVSISMELIFQGMGEFFRFAIPSAFMICLEWWSYEFLTVLSGLLPNPKLETSVLSVCLSTLSTLYAIPEGLGAAASTRVSNELGARNPNAARIAVWTLMILTAVETAIVSLALLASRNVFGYIFSNEEEVVDYVRIMAPLVCLCLIWNSFEGVLSGVARGCGWQDLGAYVNLAAYYLFGIPIGALLGFWLQFRGKGLWIGIQAGAFLQTLLLSLITACTNWERQASKARERLFEERLE
ncbi:Multi antimicrobial extrusion protein [Corchorus capsularis]|uniref:Protein DETOXIFICATION n=1 Tax=Corchorus capsularis TaxID=210143 RepID=A0A1R3JU22_COCAP|nr:Multi antimicrobial extrusion protein [Corchorus capsularis]